MSVRFEGITRVWKRFTLKIPREVLEKVDLKPGEIVLVFTKGDTIILKPLRDVKLGEDGELIIG